MSPYSASRSKNLSGLLLFLFHILFTVTLALPFENTTTLAADQIRKIVPTQTQTPSPPSPSPSPQYTPVCRDPAAAATASGLPCPIDTNCYVSNTSGKLVCH
ncbi:hypothetical protein EMPG_17308 [Blastomyces silverae]|uniref:EGF-like domain-containing protein n=1 Tax=Blastomyces silverae TaxID=2060906 RepID=A0A0H1B7X7_9EURO|nr:hypothetical protein EMPG_17308 [Blastomyces silverae]